MGVTEWLNYIYAFFERIVLQLFQNWVIFDVPIGWIIVAITIIGIVISSILYRAR